MLKSGSAARSPLLRKYLMKLTQRLGLTCLPHCTPAWRYVSRTSSLGENMSSWAAFREIDRCDHSVVDSSKSQQNQNCPEDEGMDVPDILEEIIEILLSGLKDRVRNSEKDFKVALESADLL